MGEVGTVPAAGSVGACTCGLDRQWGRRRRRGRCDGQRWESVEGCPGRKASGGGGMGVGGGGEGGGGVVSGGDRGGGGGECGLYRGSGLTLKRC